MASVTQTIPTYTGGISQQPDQLKNPGQVNTAINVMPDITDGLSKRPGSRFITEMSTSNPTCKWFSYYRDEAEQYIGRIQLSDGTVRMWKCSDGSEKDVDYQSDDVKNYLKQTNSAGNIIESDIQTLTLNDNTYLVNRNKTVAMSDTNKTGVRPHEAFVSLKKIAYSSQYSLNLFDNTNLTTVYTATRLHIEREIDSSNSCATASGSSDTGDTFTPSGNLPGSTVDGVDYNIRCLNSASSNDHINEDSYCPNVDTRIFAVDHGDSGEASDANNTAHTYSVTANGGNASDRKNLYFRITTTGQSVAEGDADDNPKYACRYTTTVDLLYGGEGWREGDVFYVWMKNAKYKITVKLHSESKVQANLGLIRPDPTSFDSKTVVTAEGILGEIRRAMVAADPDADDWVDWDENNQYGIKQIGNGLYISNPTTFNVSTPVSDLLNVFTNSVKDVADLPSQCKNGYIVKVANTRMSDEDDYYTRFYGANNRDGSGVWIECPEPGIVKSFDPATMPHILQRQADGDFLVKQYSWKDRTVGDDVTNPLPSFVGSTINKVVFFRNRLVFLSGENVVCSRPGTVDNPDFWNVTALTISATDPVDIACASLYPSDLFDGIVSIHTGYKY